MSISWVIYDFSHMFICLLWFCHRLPKEEIFDRGSVYMRDVMRISYIFFFSFYFRYIILVHGSYDHYWHTLYLYSLFSDVCFSSTLICVVSFLSLYTWFLLLVCNLLFLFHTKMPWWVLFKVFQKYKLSKSTCHKLFSCKVF